jgi:Restriction endonuclease
MPSLDSGRIADLLLQADAATSNQEKGRIFEDLVAYVFEEIPGISVTARNELSAFEDEEIDIAFWNDAHPDGLRQFDPIILVECKNWSTPVGSRDVAWFLEKLRTRGRPFGVLVAAHGITGGPDSTAARQVLRDALKEQREIVVLTREEIAAFTHTDDVVASLKLKRAVLAASAGAL